MTVDEPGNNPDPEPGEDRKGRLEQLERGLWMLGHNIRSLEYNQLSKYYQIWLMLVETVILTIGGTSIAVASYFAVTDSLDTAQQVLSSAAMTFLVALTLLTLLLRAAWLANNYDEIMQSRSMADLEEELEEINERVEDMSDKSEAQTTESGPASEDSR